MPGEHGRVCGHVVLPEQGKGEGASTDPGAANPAPRFFLKSRSAVQRGQNASEWYRAAAGRKKTALNIFSSDQEVSDQHRSSTPSKSKNVLSTKLKKAKHDLPPSSRRAKPTQPSKLTSGKDRNKKRRCAPSRAKAVRARGDVDSARGSNWRPDDVPSDPEQD